MELRVRGTQGQCSGLSLVSLVYVSWAAPPFLVLSLITCHQVIILTGYG
jgi:hypothetical protein